MLNQENHLDYAAWMYGQADVQWTKKTGGNHDNRFTTIEFTKIVD